MDSSNNSKVRIGFGNSQYPAFVSTNYCQHFLMAEVPRHGGIVGSVVLAKISAVVSVGHPGAGNSNITHNILYTITHHTRHNLTQYYCTVYMITCLKRWCARWNLHIHGPHLSDSQSLLSSHTQSSYILLRKLLIILLYCAVKLYKRKKKQLCKCGTIDVGLHTEKVLIVWIQSFISRVHERAKSTSVCKL